MAIAYDNALQPQVNSSVSSVTRSFTITGTDPFLFTWALTTSATDMSGQTYNGVSLTKAGEVNLDAFSTEAYYLCNPATGANNLVYTQGTSTTFVTTATSYTGAKSSFTPVTNTASGTGTTLSGSLTTTVDNSWIVTGTRTDGAEVAASGTNYTRRSSNASNGVHIGDSNAALTPTGSKTIDTTKTGSFAWKMFFLQIEPSVAASTFRPRIIMY